MSQWRSTVTKSKEEQERIMIACHASPEGKSSGLARIQNFKPINIVRQSNTSGWVGGGGGGGGGGGSCTLAIGQIRAERGG